MRIRSLVLAASAAACWCAAADTVDPRVRTFVDPVRVVWTSNPAPDANKYNARAKVTNAEALLGAKYGQIPETGWRKPGGCILENGGNEASVLLDFGRELHGGLQFGVAAAGTRNMKARIRFGESVAEAMADLGERGAGNDHAIRDGVIDLPFMGQREIGNTGFRFVRIDLVTTGRLQLEFVRAVSLMRPWKMAGAFKSSDARLNAVFDTAARTAHLCCQEYLWDGIKRDRLVWMGDTHPETMTILACFGAQSILPESLDYMAATTKPTDWMNTMPSYTLWWIRNVYEWWFATGDVAYLRKHHDYIRKTCANLVKHIGPDGSCKLPRGFLDWPTQHNEPAVWAGMQALMVTTFANAATLARALGDADLEKQCRDAEVRMRKYRPEPAGAKSSAALLALAGLQDPARMYDEVLGKKGHEDVSTFYGYYMLEAMSLSGHDQRALDTVRDYWGAMLDVGATSFWEDFHISWTNNCFRLDELPVAGKKDIHGDYGEFCYNGFRHSLCHGWSSGPAAWCIHHVLGIQPLEAGGKTVRVKPFLGDLAWAEGAYPTPFGPVRVRAEKKGDGTVATTINAPEGVRIVRE